MAPSSWPFTIIQKTLCSCRVLRIACMIVNNLCSFWRFFAPMTSFNVQEDCRRNTPNLAWLVVQVCDLLLHALCRRGHWPAPWRGAAVVGDRLTGLWRCGFGGAGRSSSFLGLCQVRIQGLALGSPGFGHSVHRHQYGNLWAFILRISADSHRKPQPPQARQGQKIEHCPPGCPQKECDWAVESRNERKYA